MPKISCQLSIGTIYRRSFSDIYSEKEPSITMDYKEEQIKAWQDLFIGERKRRGLNQIDVAKEAKVSQSMIVDVERGPVNKSFSFDRLAKIARFYGISLDHLAEILEPRAVEGDRNPRVKALAERLTQADEITLNMIERILRCE